ncbi:MAG: shikimate kinase [Bauldia sp.]|nr:shikimate kinase [Bauldia sp.]MCW5719443.1 shikimate kinase [Bauldia sp.]
MSTETIEDNPSPERLVTAAGIARRLGRRPIVLVGMMGAGKSSIGKRLATRLGLPFCDADIEIEKAANQTIPEIFEQHGEPYFRAGERRVILRLVTEGARVIATGGGAYMDAETRAAIAGAGVAIWLNADLDVLLARVRRRSNRPLLKNGDPEETLRRLLAERNPVYAEAPIHVKSREVSHETVIDEVLGALDAWLDSNPAPAATQ